MMFQEAEQQEYEKFVSAVNTCKWYFWTSECTVPPPDPLLFMKHMNPLKIAIRMFTSFISEPIIAIDATIKIMLHSVTSKKKSLNTLMKIITNLYVNFSHFCSRWSNVPV